MRKMVNGHYKIVVYISQYPLPILSLGHKLHMIYANIIICITGIRHT